VEVQLKACARQIELRISDDGVGMAAGALDKAGSLGLLGLRERARTVGGTLSMERRSAGGTTLILGLPVSQPIQAGELPAI
jgi:signal transduction histidine kinase